MPELVDKLNKALTQFLSDAHAETKQTDT
jgi:hypothetical protein